jgi:hypothetical protein
MQIIAVGSTGLFALHISLYSDVGVKFLCLELVSKLEYVRFKVFTAVTMKNGIFWDVTPCVPCNNRRFGGT